MYDWYVKLRHVNSGLLIGIVIVNLYVIIAPLIPSMQYAWQQRQSGGVQRLEEKVNTAVARQSAATPVYQPNGIIVPSMLLDQPILEGPQRDMYKVLDKGIWRWPAGSTPDKGSNTVLLGHRFTYKNPNGVLYHLDKVQVGDTIGLTWDNKKYVYKVASVRTVPPTATEITAPTEKPTLTVYTCTPLWTPKNRLVVTAVLEQSV